MSASDDPGGPVNSHRFCIVYHLHGRWEVLPADGRRPVPCATLEDARRIAHLTLPDSDDCELIVRDAYNRVAERELIQARGATAQRSAEESQP